MPGKIIGCLFQGHYFEVDFLLSDDNHASMFSCTCLISKDKLLRLALGLTRGAEQLSRSQMYLNTSAQPLKMFLIGHSDVLESNK